MRRVLLLTASLLLASSASAQRSGLLLGFSADSGYRTLWIAPIEGNVRVAAAVPAIIVPRADGFHHLATVRHCGITEHGEGGEGGPYSDQIDVVVDLKLGLRPPAPDTSQGLTSCDSAAAIVEVHTDSLARLDSVNLAAAHTWSDSMRVHQPGDDGDGTDICAFNYVRITYASSRYYSTAQSDGTTEFCNPGRYTTSERRYVVRVDSGAEVGLLEFLPPARARAIARTWKREKGECALEDGPDENWGIERALGEWRAEFSTSGPTVCRGQGGNEDEGFTIVQRVPAPLARTEPLGRWLPQLKAFAPKLADAFVSPAGDLVAARVGDRLSVFTPRNGKLGAPVLVVDLRKGEQVVMAEWATGAFVDRWTRELSTVHERW